MEQGTDEVPAAFPGNGPPREELPLPTAPPYTAFIGNLTFETDEAELSSFFSDLKVVSAKTIKDATGKAKGFGYVEFGGLEELKTALSRTGGQLGGRTIRVSVAEAREFLLLSLEDYAPVVSCVA